MSDSEGFREGRKQKNAHANSTRTRNRTGTGTRKHWNSQWHTQTHLH